MSGFTCPSCRCSNVHHLSYVYEDDYFLRWLWILRRPPYLASRKLVEQEIPQLEETSRTSKVG